jgi:hypothetical protein
MKHIAEQLRNVAKGKITKGKIEDIRALHDSALELFDSVAPVSCDADDESDFDDAQLSLEDALDNLSNACDSFEEAESKDEREDALGEISDAMEEVATGIEELFKVSVPDTEGRAAFDQSFLEVLRRLIEEKEKNPESVDLNVEVQKWIADTPDSSVRLGRQAAVARFVKSSAERNTAGES